MTTRGEAMTKDAESTLRKMTALTKQSFSRADLSALIEPFTSRLEYFFKAVVFPTCNRRTNLHDLIENLGPLGLSNSDVAALQGLRILYNTSKHDPDVELQSQDCARLLQGVADALKAISGIGIASVDATHEQSLNTVVYVGFWDHYVGGETEVGLFLPSDHWMGTTPISTFHFPMSSWDHLKPLLAGHPRYSRGEEALGAALWKSFSGEGDFLDAGVWEGDARELLALLSAHNDEELEKAVIPFLARRNNSVSVGIALISAAVDIVRADPTLTGEELRNRVENRAKDEYAAETKTPHGQQISDCVIDCLESIQPSQRVAISGPAFRLYSEKDDGKLKLPIKIVGSTFIWLVS